MADRCDPPPSPCTPAARRTSRTSRSTCRSRWRRRTSRAATSSTAATATRPGRRSRTRSARSRAAAAWPSPPAWPRSRPCSTWSATGDKVVVPRHSYNGTLLSSPTSSCAAGSRTDAGRHHRHRRGGRGLRGRGAGVVRVAHQPGPRGGRRRRRSSPPPTRPAPASSSTTPSRPRCSSGRSSSAPTSSLHSATKYLAGPQRRADGRDRHRATTSCTACSRAAATCRATIPGTLEAWLALRGLRTLHLRVERAQANAAELARRLADHPALSEVRYPGFGGIVSIVLADGADAADLLVRAPRAVGARHQPRRRGVDLRAPAPLEGRET